MSLYACFFLLLYGECEEDSWSCETAPCQMAPGDNKHHSALGCGKADILSTFARPHSISHIKDEFLFWILMGFYICYFFFLYVTSFLLWLFRKKLQSPNIWWGSGTLLGMRSVSHLHVKGEHFSADCWSHLQEGIWTLANSFQLKTLRGCTMSRLQVLSCIIGKSWSGKQHVVNHSSYVSFVWSCLKPCKKINTPFPGKYKLFPFVRLWDWDNKRLAWGHATEGLNQILIDVSKSVCI